MRILWEDEETKDADIDGDLAEFKLSIHPELREQPEERRRLAQSAEIDYEAHTAVVPINSGVCALRGVSPRFSSAYRTSGLRTIRLRWS